MAYTKNSYGVSAYKTNLRYPKRVSKRESKVIQTAVDTAIANYTLVTANYTVTDEIQTVATSGALTVTLPDAALNAGRPIKVACVVNGAVTLAAAGGTVSNPGAIDTAGESASFISDGTNWITLEDDVVI